VELDRVQIELSVDHSTWHTVFNWGDNDPINTDNTNASDYGRDLEGLPGDGEADNEHIPLADL